MSTTDDQKAGILLRWRKHREERKLPADVKAQCKFNWPSISPAEIKAVIEALQRREAMAKNDERPSAPSKLAKHVFKCTLGDRLYVESFTQDKSAKAFLELMVGKEKPKWKTDKSFTTHDGTCEIFSEHLEELFEMRSGGVTLAEPIPSQVEAFLRGKWKVKEPEGKVSKVKTKNAPATKAVKAKDVKGIDGTTLDQFCKLNKWEPRRVRQAMRKAKWVKPAGGWSWALKDAPDIEKKLKVLMK